MEFLTNGNQMGFHRCSLVGIQEAEEVVAVPRRAANYLTGRSLRVENIQEVSPVVVCIGIGDCVSYSPGLLSVLGSGRNPIARVAPQFADGLNFLQRPPHKTQSMAPFLSAAPCRMVFWATPNARSATRRPIRPSRHARLLVPSPKPNQRTHPPTKRPPPQPKHAEGRPEPLPPPPPRRQ